eukprot:TRINITY_DN14338_c0_g1_i1.p1 TRINITY_DN14338_c0_g1~~TRINITY_DN14338_c0_g1_i1.p1  ORF type:complete len:301 (+),score=54.48 TRINITY_DN14338_c0_g1_i1:528-1430(+)
MNLLSAATRAPAVIEDVIARLRTSAGVAKPAVVYFGESHSVPSVLAAQLDLLRALAPAAGGPADLRTARTHLVLEMFNVQQQSLLDRFAAGATTQEELARCYDESSEGFPMSHYCRLIECARDQGVVCHAGFVPREMARLMVANKRDALQQAAEMFPAEHFVEGNAKHFKYFCSLMTEHPGLDSTDELEASPRMRSIFDAQVLKDSCMASVVFGILQRHKASGSPQPVTVLAIAGSGHIDCGFGISERVRFLCKQSNIEVDDVIVTTRPSSDPPGSPPPGDFICVYDEHEEDQEESGKPV